MNTKLLEKLLALPSPIALKTYLLLAAAQKAGGNVRIYRKDIGGVLKRSERTITRAIRVLRTAGLLTRIGRGKYAVSTTQTTS